MLLDIFVERCDDKMRYGASSVDMLDGNVVRLWLIGQLSQKQGGDMGGTSRFVLLSVGIWMRLAFGFAQAIRKLVTYNVEAFSDSEDGGRDHEGIL